MGQDVSLEIAGQISGAKVFGSSENIRHGKYKMLIKRIFAELVETDSGKNKMAFVECTPLEALPNPQVEGDHTDYPGTSGPLIDDGTKPNSVGSACAMKINFDGPGGRSAGSNVKAFILALFNKHDGEIPDAEINQTWIDLARRVDLKPGDAIGIDPNTHQVIHAKEYKRSNPACGMIINLSTMPKKKKTPNNKGGYITKLVWTCAAPIGSGENAPELVAKRRAEIEATMVDDEEVAQIPTPAPMAPPPPAVPQMAAPLPPSFPPAGWEVHPTAPGWFWNRASNAVKNEAQLRAGQ